ncbi:phosphoribosylformylglycinamidine synthase [Altibacter sp. HG106]|uniref:phosphoribosylformylglycinamidine synthase n=1 Tax=Altibacter sp. HG106 TaxID=3023937 RepID=UPI00234FCE32|nr:phosphoribosylformylglycinamidine synthase [Altibacter sp. HG106]MDC7993783.1 phosphoribosylformylglycinamidine synthase [Altibacter sp. HG106]
MIYFFGDEHAQVFAVQTSKELDTNTIQKLEWLFGNQPLLSRSALADFFVGPRKTMITPWSTNAVEITQNMQINGVSRIETFQKVTESYTEYDPMLQQKYNGLDQTIFTIDIDPAAILEIDDIASYNQQEGLALSEDEISYLEALSKKLNRKLTDSEVFGFSQVNSEHCRHKIFNGTFVIDGTEMDSSLFQLIKKTSEANPNDIVSAYKDNVAFVKGPKALQFAPKRPDVPDFYQNTPFDSVISLKAETHNFPTTVEPFNGAATGSGGEIRDRLAGGKGSLPLAGTAVYMTSYSRLEENRPWEKAMPERDWLYQTPLDILIKASNGASDFGNKFGQPLIAGSVLTFEHEEDARRLGFDKVIMLAGGIGYGKASQALKDIPETGDQVVLLGGENYRIGMGGAAVSSADTGEFESGIELNAIQRSNPEMQKRAANAIRGMVENEQNPIVSIHDHGAGGHLNCLSELVEETGGNIDLDKLPVGDPTLSAKELIGNESQERMGLVIGQKDMEILERVAKRERSPLYCVGTVTGDHRFRFESSLTGAKPMDFQLEDMFGSSPKTIMNDRSVAASYKEITATSEDIKKDVHQLLQLEAVGCKDWLTNKVDRCVTGRVAAQQCVGPLQLPLNNCGVMALDYQGKNGVATSIGHSPISALVDPVAGSRNSVTEALTNLVWAPLDKGLSGVSLSANWMWPCNNEGEDARLYQAVKGISEFAIDLGINIPTGKDSLSMKQKYKDGEVIAPGTVIISSVGHCSDITKVVEPVLQKEKGSLFFIDWSQDSRKLGGSSFGQLKNRVGKEVPTVHNAAYVKKVFNAIQSLVKKEALAAGHDIASGGLVTTLLELCFADTNLGASLDLSALGSDFTSVLFAENCGVVVQAMEDDALTAFLSEQDIAFHKLGSVTTTGTLELSFASEKISFDIAETRDVWYRTSYLLDQHQSGKEKALERFTNYKNQPLTYQFPKHFTGALPQVPEAGKRIKGAILREKGSNSEREMAQAMYLAGFDVKDVHMTDLIEGREDLKDIQFIAAVGGFSNSDVLGSAKGWAGAIKYNERANKALNDFFDRDDTLSLGVCNGCQLFVALGLINPNHEEKPKMLHNDTQKFECSFTSVTIAENPSVMLGNLAGSTLGIWAAHGEGKFEFPYAEDRYNIVGKYGYDKLPANPNGSDFNTAALCDDTGRHLVIMPHLERSTFPWNWAHYPSDRNDKVSPWLQAFVNAREWLEKK